jgi:3-oxoacyl-[acyl-carrier protein] reductase
MDLGLKNRRAIVLAASKGLGRGTAEALAAEGCAVVLCSRSQEDSERVAREIASEYGVPVSGFACDVAVAGDLDRFFARALETLGGVDILVNNAGGPPPGPAEGFDDAAWQAAIELTLMSVIRGCRHVLPVMKQGGFGRILNITSVAVKQPLPNMALSNTLRAAVAGYSKSLAQELAAHGILVHCVMPGSFLTDRNRTLGSAIAEQRGIPFEDLVKEWETAVPLGRMGDPREFGDMIAFLASERCSFTTGTCVAVDGGTIRSLT